MLRAGTSAASSKDKVIGSACSGKGGEDGATTETVCNDSDSFGSSPFLLGARIFRVFDNFCESAAKFDTSIFIHNIKQCNVSERWAMKSYAGLVVVKMVYIIFTASYPNATTKRKNQTESVS